MTDIFKTGLIPLDPVKHARFKTAAAYGFTWPTPVYPIDKTAGIIDFGMGGNGPDPTLTVNNGQPVGDCGPNAVPKNANMITALEAGLELSAYTMTSDQIVNLYFEFTGGQDTGVDLGDWLLWLFNRGLIKGFVKLELSEMDAALGTPGVIVVVGVSLNPQADEQAQNNPPLWDIGPGDEPDLMRGHAIDYIYAESPTGLRRWASWAMQISSTYEWFQACPQQAFAVITDPDAFAVCFKDICADLTSLGGTVFVPVAEMAPAVKGSWSEWIAELDRLKSWSNDRELAHKLLTNAIENESVNLLAGELGVLAKFL